jgi:transposase
MSLHPRPAYEVPPETRRVARAAFPRGNIYMQVADVLGALYRDEQFAALFPARGRAAEAPARLALVTVLQFAEGLSDRQAADAVRGRIDWKYALALPLTDPGFDSTVLSEFRTRLVAGGAEQQLLDTLLARVRDLGLLKVRGRQRTDSTHVLAAVRVLNRLERVGETLRAALNALAVVAPDWLRAQAAPEWYERYSRRVENYRLPKTDAAREALAALIGADGRTLLRAVDAAPEAAWLRELPAVKTLRQVWTEQYTDPPDPVRWRAVKELPSTAEQIASPYDPDARWTTKQSVAWVGYKVHLTESCDPDAPRLITHVETTPATTPDDMTTSTIHDGLAARDLLPGEHLVDTGYTNAEVLVTGQQRHGVTVIGPVALDASWQARAGTGFEKDRFHVDWEAHTVTCPAGKLSRSWLRNTDPTKPGAIQVHFRREDCLACGVRAQCTRRTREPRELLLQPRAEHTALQAARQHQTTAAFKAQYASRAGIEATHAQGIRRCGLRQCRYIGFPKTRLQHLLTATALNVVRLGEWWLGTPQAKTRHSAFAALQPLQSVV